MGDRITWFEDCPKCGKKDGVECYEALSSLMKFDECMYCDFTRRFEIDDTKDVITITQVTDMEQAKPTPTSTGDSKPPKHSCTAEIIAELERLRDNYKEVPHPMFYQDLKERISKLKAKETQL